MQKNVFGLSFFLLAFLALLPLSAQEESDTENAEQLVDNLDGSVELQAALQSEIDRLIQELQSANGSEGSLRVLQSRERRLNFILGALKQTQDYILLVPSGAIAAWIISALGLEALRASLTGGADPFSASNVFETMTSDPERFPFGQKLMIGAIGLAGALSFRGFSGWLWSQMIQNRIDRVMTEFDDVSTLALDDARNLATDLGEDLNSATSDQERQRALLPTLRRLRRAVEDLRKRSRDQQNRIIEEHKLDRGFRIIRKPVTKTKLDIAGAKLDQDLLIAYYWILIETLRNIEFTNKDEQFFIRSLPLHASELPNACQRALMGKPIKE